MSKTVLELKDIARAGGGLSLDSTKLSTLELKEIGRAAKPSGATIIIRNAHSKTTLELKEIARTSPGKIIFEL